MLPLYSVEIHGAFSIVWCTLKESPDSQSTEQFPESIDCNCIGDTIHNYYNESIVPTSHVDTYKQVLESQLSFHCSVHLWCLLILWKFLQESTFQAMTLSFIKVPQNGIISQAPEFENLDHYCYSQISPSRQFGLSPPVGGESGKIILSTSNSSRELCLGI